MGEKKETLVNEINTREKKIQSKVQRKKHFKEKQKRECINLRDRGNTVKVLRCT